MSAGDRRLDHKVVLVTGAGGGLGTEIARRLAGEGARLILTDRDAGPCTALIDELPAPGGTHLALAFDVTDETAWASALTNVSAELGALHALVNNAAIGGLGNVEDEQRQRWDRILDIGATGVWLGMKHAGRLIRRSGGGSIVNMCSILGTGGGFGDSAAYHAAKGAVRTLTKNAALHWATTGVRVNSLHPGFIETPQLADLYKGSERYDRMTANTPMGRLGRPEEIAAVVAFLVSDDASFMTGSEVYADGGWTAK